MTKINGTRIRAQTHQRFSNSDNIGWPRCSRFTFPAKNLVIQYFSTIRTNVSLCFEFYLQFAGIMKLHLTMIDGRAIFYFEKCKIYYRELKILITVSKLLNEFKFFKIRKLITRTKPKRGADASSINVTNLRNQRTH